MFIHFKIFLIYPAGSHRIALKHIILFIWYFACPSQTLRRQAFPLTNAGLLLIGPFRKNCCILIKNTKLFIHEKASENIVSDMVTILSKGRWVTPSKCSRVTHLSFMSPSRFSVTSTMILAALYMVLGVWYILHLDRHYGPPLPCWSCKGGIKCVEILM